jgi:hypothetical protein
MSDERKLVYLGSFSEGLPSVVVLPRLAIRKVEAALDREQTRREVDVERARLRVVQQVSARSKLKRAMHAVFRRGRGR